MTKDELENALRQIRDEAIQRAKEDMRQEMEESHKNLNEEIETNIEERIQQAKSDIFPIGSIYISTNGTNPEKMFGGKWEEYGKGKTLVGVDESQTGFNRVEVSGGAKTVTLNSDNLPSHNHTIPALSGTTSDSGSHSHNYSKANTPTGGTSLTIDQMPKHSHEIKSSIGFIYSDYYTGGSTQYAYIPRASFTGYSNPVIATEQGKGQAHTHTIGFTATATTAAGVHSHTVSTTANSTGYSGGGKEFSVQNPYITVYIWKKVAE